jgi:hypothetical protein
VAAGETVRVDLGTTGGEKLTVRVTTPGGLPRTLAGRLMVLVYDRSIASGAPSVLHLLPDGTGVYEGPRPGALDVVVATTPHAASIVQLARREEIAPGEREVRFELPAGELPVHHVRGRIVDGVRAPVSGVTVRAQRTDSPSLVVLVETTTAADGTFAIGPLPYGLTTGSLTERTPVGDALLTADSDAHVGDLVLPSR